MDDSHYFYNPHGVCIDHLVMEREEQLLALEFVEPRHVVLELGARYGTVTCAIVQALGGDASRVVAVEPDARVWPVLERNLAANGAAGVRLVKGFVASRPLVLVEPPPSGWTWGYGVSARPLAAGDDADVAPPCTSLACLQDACGLRFTALVADCEGFLGTFFEENPAMLQQLELVIFEQDGVDHCDYGALRAALCSHGFVGVRVGIQSVYRKPPPPRA